MNIFMTLRQNGVVLGYEIFRLAEATLPGKHEGQLQYFYSVHSPKGKQIMKTPSKSTNKFWIAIQLTWTFMNSPYDLRRKNMSDNIGIIAYSETKKKTGGIQGKPENLRQVLWNITCICDCFFWFESDTKRENWLTTKVGQRALEEWVSFKFRKNLDITSVIYWNMFWTLISSTRLTCHLTK